MLRPAGGRGSGPAPCSEQALHTPRLSMLRTPALPLFPRLPTAPPVNHPVRSYELPADYATLVLQYRHVGGTLSDCLPRYFNADNSSAISCAPAEFGTAHEQQAAGPACRCALLPRRRTGGWPRAGTLDG